MKVTDQTKQLAQDILDYWDNVEGSHEQENWYGSRYPKASVKVVNGKEMDVCNTTMCAAGTAVFLRDGVKSLIINVSYGNISDKAGEYLGLSSSERGHLFLDTSNQEAKDLMRTIADGDEAKFHAIMGYHLNKF